MARGTPQPADPSAPLRLSAPVLQEHRVPPCPGWFGCCCPLQRGGFGFPVGTAVQEPGEWQWGAWCPHPQGWLCPPSPALSAGLFLRQEEHEVA